MKVLFIVTSSTLGTWLAEVTRPFWHLTERGHEVTFATPGGLPIVWDRLSDPHTEGSFEANDLVSLGFLSNEALVRRLATPSDLKDIDPSFFDAVHVAGGTGAAVDLYPNVEVARILEHFWATGKVLGTICHGSIALANNPDRVAGRSATGFTLAEDIAAEAIYGPKFIPFYPQPVMEGVGIEFIHVEPQGVKVIVDGRLITGQNQQSASEYAIAMTHLMKGKSPLLTV